MSEPTDDPPREGAGEDVGTESAPAIAEPVASIEVAPSPNQFPPPEPLAPSPNQFPPPDDILPPAADLQEAVGAPTRRRRDPEPVLDPDDPVPPKNRRVQMIAALSLFGGLAIVALIFLGRANSDRYLLVCSTDRVTPEQGRSFPPWGSHPLAGPAWKPIALPANAECTERETDSLAELEKLYLDQLVDRASTTLTSKTLLDKQGSGSSLDHVTDELTQALLLARSPERRDQRKEIERLQGDVTYWRATLRLRDAQAALIDAAKQFDAAAAQRPRHVTDADAWASYLRKLTDELHAGPNGEPSAPASVPQSVEGPHAPAGSALPVEPPPSEAPPPVDAGLPTGGVLL
ncbi:MAG: hypothetical protein JO257_18225 [Deltaproteobacteria bacterium]|nr:hypothetical protein [Deltaproteobacteria bacterium]